MHALFYFNGVHEIATLSWFFYVKIKEQNQTSIQKFYFNW